MAGRWVPGLHAAAVAVGLFATFLPLMRTNVPSNPDPLSSYLGSTSAIEWSFWEVHAPAGADQWMGGDLEWFDPTAPVRGKIVVLALLVLGVAGVLAAATTRGRPAWAQRARSVSWLGAGAVAGVVAVVAAETIVNAQPREIDGVQLNPWEVGPSVAVLVVAAVIGLAAAVCTAIAVPVAAPGVAAADLDVADLDTAPQGLRLPDHLDGDR